MSGFFGTTQGFVGHGARLPIHGLADRPHSVLLLQGVDAAYEAFRSLLARGLRDGFITDAMAHEIPLTQAIVVLEASGRRQGRRLGFRVGMPGGPPPHGDQAASAEAIGALAVGRELAAECDLVAISPDGPDALHVWVEVVMERVAAAYRSAGVQLAWEAGVADLLAADLREAGTRDRERARERRLARMVRPLLGDRHGALRVRLRVDGGSLAADAET
jgi:hypothetical protein